VLRRPIETTQGAERADCNRTALSGGSTIYHKPGPTLQGVSGINSDLNYLIFVDRQGVLGLGNDVPMTGGG
jgi:hypothetical protein